MTTANRPIRVAGLLKERATDDLLRIIEDHESGYFPLPPASIRAVRDEFYSRLPESGERPTS